MVKKTRNIKRTTRVKKNTRKIMRKTSNSIISDLPMNFPISHASHKHPITTASSSSTTAMNAVYANGRWHVDTDINGEKSHANLTNSQLMKLLAHPASKKDLRTSLLEKLNDIDSEYSLTPPIIMKICNKKPIQNHYRKLHDPLTLESLTPLHEVNIIPSNEVVHLKPKPKIKKVKKGKK
jgi:hypothetical protein